MVRFPLKNQLMIPKTWFYTITNSRDNLPSARLARIVYELLYSCLSPIIVLVLIFKKKISLAFG